MRKSLEVICLAVLAFIVWITYQALHGPNPLPEKIPTHFDAAGNPNGWGSSSALLLLPAMAVGLYLLITITAQFPAAFKFPVPVTAENRQRLEALTLRMIAWIKIELVCLFTWIQWFILSAVRQGHGTLSPVLVPLFLIAIFATVGWHIIAVFRAEQAGSSA